MSFAVVPRLSRNHHGASWLALLVAVPLVVCPLAPARVITDVFLARAQAQAPVAPITAEPDDVGFRPWKTQHPLEGRHFSWIGERRDSFPETPRPAALAVTPVPPIAPVDRAAHPAVVATTLPFSIGRLAARPAQPRGPPAAAL